MPIPPEALLVVLRYVLSWCFVWLAQHGYVQSAVPDEVANATAEIILGAGGAVGMLLWGLWRSRVPVLLARLKAYHKPALVAAAGAVSLSSATDILTAAADVPGVRQIIAEPTIAAATPSDKVIAAGQE